MLTPFLVAQVADPGASQVLGWGTLSLLNAGLAQSKNRSGLAWWFASLFLGPVATFFLVVLDRVEPVPAVALVKPSGVEAEL